MFQSLASDLWRESVWQAWMLDISGCGHGYKLFDLNRPMTFGLVICHIYTSKYTLLLHIMTIYSSIEEGLAFTSNRTRCLVAGWPRRVGDLFPHLIFAVGSSPATCEGQGWRENKKWERISEGRGSDCSFWNPNKGWFMYCLMAVTFICSLISSMTIFNLIHRTLKTCIPCVASCQWHCTLLTVQRPYFSQWCRSALTPWVPMFSNRCHQVEPTSTNLNLTVFPNAFVCSNAQIPHY